mmetsp:Transcript_10715/g.13252  ORF Transcript_10715/g.13252 Transcript_10715/m.13252 type:complete len:234 (-) Transcript_10715:154-855(-)|eukprot:CAMPEP_0172498990 /NCGR_PEP_ID=MMETSP1066-20121228/120693_1 /TAXON_ID=671091 /ORGANISM="Coscinodiscus wailesii, Strain CCMP2513" /LENGTH=233 /DNA_ID=CAMNT_0013272511 /DNA_START=53 /DNA_END=754 /DNA_ORIENTATION=-
MSHESSETVEFDLFPIQRSKKAKDRISDRNCDSKCHKNNPFRNDGEGRDANDDDDHDDKFDVEDYVNVIDGDDRDCSYDTDDLPRDDAACRGTRKSPKKLMPAVKRKYLYATPQFTLKGKIRKKKRDKNGETTTTTSSPDEERRLATGDSTTPVTIRSAEEEDDARLLEGCDAPQTSDNVKNMLRSFQNEQEEIRVLKNKIKEMEDMVKEKEKVLKFAKDKINRWNVFKKDKK